MSEQRIKELMAELINELENSDTIDPETVQIASKLKADIEDLVNPEVNTPESTVLDDAIALEALFAAKHPLLEKTLRELVNTLSRMGV